MFVQFFSELKQAGVPVTLREYLTLMEAMEADLAGRRVEDFYYLSRATLVKDERNLDKFDRVFSHVFKGLDLIEQALSADIPEEWLRKISEKYLTEEEKKQIEALGGLDKLLETLKKRLEEQKGRHQGGKKWIGTGGTSPFGNGGYNPEGIRIGESKHRRAVKVWDKREFKDLDDSVELGTRNIKIALRRLRKFARTGAPDEFDLDNTIKGTAHKGYLDIHMRPERHNTIKVLALFDIGGSMDWHILGDEGGVQTPRAFLFPQLPVRKSLEGKPPPLPGNDADLGCAAQVSARLQGGDRRRRLHVAVRNHRARRLRGALQRGSRRRVAGARDAHLSGGRVAQSGSRGAVGLHVFDPHDPPDDGQPDVSAHAGGAGSRDAGAGAVDSHRASNDQTKKLK
jgi:hypothetical protein